MNKRKISPELSHILGLVLNRLDRLDKTVSVLCENPLGGDELLDSRDIRILTKMSDRTILRRRNDGTLPYFKHGGKIYYRKSVVLQAIQQSPDNHSKEQKR